jgi:hypothetical protein
MSELPNLIGEAIENITDISDVIPDTFTIKSSPGFLKNIVTKISSIGFLKKYGIYIFIGIVVVAFFMYYFWRIRSVDPGRGENEEQNYSRDDSGDYRIDIPLQHIPSQPIVSQPIIVEPEQNVNTIKKETQPLLSKNEDINNDINEDEKEDIDNDPPIPIYDDKIE